MTKHDQQVGIYLQVTRNGYERLVPKTYGSHSPVARLAKMSLRDRLLRLLDLVVMTFLAERLLLPPISCFLSVCRPMSLAADLIIFYR